ncbi:hypothetical protein [Clavibacter sp. VKM Ac-2872]|uniref:hypothetical protein n=1 Tax=Clavibacter sp. VKM Ac-2872 TaxID=2783812 RepID=UPI00188CB739|nr:hypothetical protein [Clavibacter sp. VKM Ac-2872]MBF4625841.1 hypothetical protein [Clavibacter sp. VKM Ac-2872]
MNDIITAAGDCAADNIMCGVKPNFDWLGPDFRNLTVIALGGFMGLALFALAFLLIKAILGLRNAKRTKKPQEAEDARNVIIGTSAAIIGVIVLPILFGALVTIPTK